MKKVLFLLLLLVIVSLISCQPKEIVIGAVLPESGNAALYGQAVKEGVQIAEAYVNSNPDFPYSFRVTYKDTGSDPDKAVILMNDVIKEGSLAIIGGVTSSEALKMADVSAKRTRVLLSPSASYAKLSGISTYFFRTYPSDKQEVIQMAKFTAEIAGATKVSILYQDNSYGEGIAENYILELKKRGILNTRKIMLPDDTTSYTPQISEALASNPDAVYTAAYADIIINVLTELKAIGFKGKLLSTSAINAPGAFARAGENAEDLYYCKPPFDIDDLENPLIKEFTTRYEEQFGKGPDVFSAYGFDSFLVLATAITNNGTYPEDVYKGLKGLQGFKGVTGPIVFNNYGDVSKFPRIFWHTKGQELDYMDYRKRERERILNEIEQLRSGKN